MDYVIFGIIGLTIFAAIVYQAWLDIRDWYNGLPTEFEM